MGDMIVHWGECSLPYQNRVSWLQSLLCFSHHLPDVAKVFQILSEQAQVMKNQPCDFSQSETEKYFEWIDNDDDDLNKYK